MINAKHSFEGVDLLRVNLLKGDEETPPTSEDFQPSSTWISLQLTSFLAYTGVVIVLLSGVALFASGVRIEVRMTHDSRSKLTSWNTGSPPQLSAVRKHDWVSCEEYTSAQIDEIKMWEQYWMNRINKDYSLGLAMKKVDLGDAVREKIGVKYPKAAKTYHSCEYYSMGLSGPWNGQPVRPPVRKVTDENGWFWDDADDEYIDADDNTDDNDDDDDGLCHATNDGYVGCDLSWYESLSIIDSSYISVTGTAEAEFSFLVNHTNCDISADVGGDMFLTFELDTWTHDSIVTVDVLSAPGDGIIPMISDSMFTLDVGLTNINNNTCCLDNWWLTITPGYNDLIYSGDSSLDIGLVNLDFSEHSNQTYRSSDCITTESNT